MKMNMRWQIKGKKDGVTIIEGDSDVPSPWIFRILFGVAGIEATAGIVAILGGLIGHTAGPQSTGVGLLIAASIHGGIGRWMYLLRQRMLYLVPQEEMAGWLGVEKAQVETLLVENGIKPAYVVNGRPFYNRADFDTGALLRASSAPEATEDLLRPAHDQADPAELLLRASQSSSEPPVKTTQQEQKPQYQQIGHS